MKLKNFIKVGLLAAVISATSISCSKKEDGGVQPSSQTPTQAELIKKLKNLKFSFSEPGSGNYNYDASTNTLSYVEPVSGQKYSEPVAGFTYSDVKPSLSGNLSKGGGSFEVDGQTITLDYVFCLSGSEENPFGMSAGEGMSLLFGISGDFNTNNPDASKLNHFVMAFVSEEKANGSYKIIFQGDEEDTNVDKFAFISVVDLTKVKGLDGFDDSPDAKFYFSTKGSLKFSNGNVGLENIKMVEITKGQGEDDDVVGKEVSASGELSCE